MPWLLLEFSNAQKMSLYWRTAISYTSSDQESLKAGLIIGLCGIGFLFIIRVLLGVLALGNVILVRRSFSTDILQIST